jgi:hypothetical protein
MSLPLSIAARPLLRRSALLQTATRRLESTATTGKAASAAKETASKAGATAKETASRASSAASEYAGKAQEGLSRVTSSAGPAIVSAAKGVSGALSRVGGRTGRMIAFVERMFCYCCSLLFCCRHVSIGLSFFANSPVVFAGQVPFVIYYSRVGIELSKIVFRGQKMTPP